MILTFGLYSAKLELMSRIIFKDNEQTKFFQQVLQSSDLNIDKLALLCNVSSRTFRDWARGKYNIPESALLILVNKFSMPVPENIKIVNDYWYAIKGARQGALKRSELYGPLGTPDGRRRGGIQSQTNRKANPEMYKLLGCNLRKEFKITSYSVPFAEVAGIILGDGAISDCQLRITLSSLVDVEYATFVTSLFRDVFGEKPTLLFRKRSNAIDLTISGVGLIERLGSFGFIKGDKVKHQVDFPEWIWKNTEFQKACVRGLMDTDGGCYFHRHRNNGLFYRNFGMCFSNESLPLITSMGRVLTKLGIKFSLAKANTRIYIYSFLEIKKYFDLIGSSNPKNVYKFNSYSHEKSHRIQIGQYATSS